MNEYCKKPAEKLLRILSSRKFADWYNKGNFDSWIAGEFDKNDPRRITDEKITEETERMFKSILST